MKYYLILSILFTTLFSILLFSGCVTNDQNNLFNDNNKNINGNNSNNNEMKKEFKEINPCDLLSEPFAESLLKEPIKDARLNDTVAPEGKSCTYFTDVVIDTRKLEVKIYQDEIVKGEGIFSGTEKYYNNLKNAKINASNLSIQELNYGSNSYFDGFDLHILQNNYYLILHVDAEKQTASNSQEMEQKLTNSRLELEKLVAEEVLKNLN